MKSIKEEFIPRRWYKCTCNDNFYQFSHIKGNTFFCHTATLNLKKISEGGTLPGLIQKLETISLLCYFRPSNIVEEEIMQEYLSKYIKQPQYAIY